VPAPHLKVAGTVGALARVPLHTATVQQPLLAGRDVLSSRASLLAQLQRTNWGELGLMRLRSSALRAFASGGVSCQVRAADPPPHPTPTHPLHPRPTTPSAPRPALPCPA
jgi:hypothetical protein